MKTGHRAMPKMEGGAKATAPFTVFPSQWQFTKSIYCTTQHIYTQDTDQTLRIVWISGFSRETFGTQSLTVRLAPLWALNQDQGNPQKLFLQRQNGSEGKKGGLGGSGEMRGGRTFFKCKGHASLVP